MLIKVGEEMRDRTDGSGGAFCLTVGYQESEKSRNVACSRSDNSSRSLSFSQYTKVG